MTTAAHAGDRSTAESPARVRSSSWLRPSPSLSTVLAGCGVASVLVGVYVIAAWIMSGDAHRTGTGVDPVPGATKLWITGYQMAGVLLLAGFAGYIVRSWRRDGVVSLVGAVFVAWTVNLWLDPATLNFVRPQMLYNSYAVNFGSWGPHIPGWISPNARLLPEPLLAYSGVYGAQVLLALIGLETMRRVRRHRPDMGALGLMVCALGVLMAVDLILEVVLIRAEFWSYAGVVQRLSIWGGRRYQFPLYEPVLFGALNVAIAAVLFFRDDRGRSFIERDSAKQPRANELSSRRRILTVTGFVTLAYIIYSAAVGILGLWGGPYPQGYKSYMLNGMCGSGTRYACMGPGVPIRQDR